MTNQELEQGFIDASKQWDRSHPANNPNEFLRNTAARYFFFAGSEFGVSITKEIYSETIGKLEAKTCPECGGTNGHKTPFCSKVNLRDAAKAGGGE